MTFNCKNCSKEYKNKSSQSKFCSYSCYWSWKKSIGQGRQKKDKSESIPFNRKKSCTNCGDSFACSYGIGKKAWDKRKYCSARCSASVHKGRKFPAMSASRMSEKNPVWKGIHASKGAIHQWIERKLGTPKYCEHCKKSDSKIYDWSNKDHKYSRKFSDWQRLCRSCYLKFDYKFNNRNICLQ